MNNSAQATPNSCTDTSLGDLLESYALGTLSAHDAERFEDHFFHCDDCRARLEAGEDVFALLADFRPALQEQLIADGEDYLSMQRTERVGKKESWLAMLGANVLGVLTSRITVGAALASLVFLTLPRIAPRLLPQLVIQQPPVVQPAPNVQPDYYRRIVDSLMHSDESVSPQQNETTESSTNEIERFVALPPALHHTRTSAAHVTSGFSLTPNFSETTGQATRYNPRTNLMQTAAITEESGMDIGMSTGVYSDPLTGATSSTFALPDARYLLVDLKGLYEKRAPELPPEIATKIREQKSGKSATEVTAPNLKLDAWRAYRKGHYKTALAHWIPLINSGEGDCDDQYYAGIAAYQCEDYLTSHDLLGRVYASGGCEDSTRVSATWYYANTLLKLKEHEPAKLVLKDIVSSRSKVPDTIRDKAVIILDKLERAANPGMLSQPK